MVELEFGSDTNQQLAFMALRDVGLSPEFGSPCRITLTEEAYGADPDVVTRVLSEYGGAVVYWGTPPA